MTKKQIARLKELNITPEKYFGNFQYTHYGMRGRMNKYLSVHNKKYSK